MSDDVKWPIVSTGSRLDCSCGERQHIVADLEKSRALVQQLDRTNERLYAALKEYTRWPIGPTSPTDAALILNAMRPMRERALAALDRVLEPKAERENAVSLNRTEQDPGRVPDVAMSEGAPTATLSVSESDLKRAREWLVTWPSTRPGIDDALAALLTEVRREAHTHGYADAIGNREFKIKMDATRVAALRAGFAQAREAAAHQAKIPPPPGRLTSGGWASQVAEEISERIRALTPKEGE